MRFSNLCFLAAAVCARSVPSLVSRAVIAHDAIYPWGENVPGNFIGNAIKRFEPYLHIASGCQAYCAVDGYGNTSGGLQVSGSATGGCRDWTKGQVYVRSTWYNGRYAIMYAWYFPKDQLADGVSPGGHRHDWEHIVVWIDNPENANPRLFGAAASSHGGYRKSTDPKRQGDRLKVEYFATFPTNHELQFTDTVGNDLPMMYYDFLPESSKQALDWTDFGSALCPFNSGNFLSKLANAQV